MRMEPDYAKPAISTTRLPHRWAALLVGTILLHLVALHWANSNIGVPPARVHDQIIVADLRAPEANRPAVFPKPKLQSKALGKAHKKARVRPRPAPVIAQAPASEAATTLATTADTALPGPDGEYAAEPRAAPEAQAVPDARTAESAAPQGVHYRVDPAPSAELKYDVQALREGQTVYGSGKIHWQTEGGKYSITGEASVLFFTLLQFRSEGGLDDFGVAPVIYSEKRFRKSETNTHFNHDERNSISFSASTASYPRTGGEQDRASIIWQLAGIGRGDSEKFVPGAEIDLFVAGVRDAETWRIRVIGPEDIEVGTGKAIAWHVVRAPRAGSYDQQLDIWLAPQQQWYPVKLRYTETNGDYLDMSLSNLSVAQSGNVPAAESR